MIKTKKRLVQKTIDEMVTQLNEKRDSIFADLDSKEESLISKVNQNPRIWNSQSLKTNLKTNKPDLSSAVSLDASISEVCFRIDVNLGLLGYFQKCLKLFLVSSIVN